MFTKEERSGWAYWFAHWCAFNMTALNLRCWHFRYLFHDWEKPWLKLLMHDYKKVQKWHREHSSHHGEFFLKHGWLHWDDLIVDWECSHFTKAQAQLVAIECLEPETQHLRDIGASAYQADEFHARAKNAMIRLGLMEADNTEFGPHDI